MKRLDEVEPRIAINSDNTPGDRDTLFKITEPGSYYLTTNITSDNRHAILIDADDVTLDLMGYRIWSSLAGVLGVYPDYDGIHIMPDHKNIEIKNGIIASARRNEGKMVWRGFLNGIFAPDVPDSEPVVNSNNIRIIDVRIADCRQSGIYISGGNSTVKDCIVVNNDSHGIYVTGANSTARGCTVANNDSEGIHLGGHSLARNNTVSDNGSYGLRTERGSTVIDNTVYRNENDGIYTWGSCTVTGNSSYENNGNGINPSGSSTVIGNTVSRNGYSGITAGQWCIVKDNTAFANNTRELNTSAGIRTEPYCLIKGNIASVNKVNNFYIRHYCSVENNVAIGSAGSSDTGNGINFSGEGTFYANNRAIKNDVNYAGSVPTGARDGGGNYSD